MADVLLSGQSGRQGPLHAPNILRGDIYQLVLAGGWIGYISRPGRVINLAESSLLANICLAAPFAQNTVDVASKSTNLSDPDDGI